MPGQKLAGIRRREEAAGSPMWSAHNRWAGCNSGRASGLNRAEGGLEENETPETTRVGCNAERGFPGIGESDEISKIHGFIGRFADGRGLRAGASQGGHWSRPGVCRDWRRARLRVWLLRVLPVCVRAVRLLWAAVFRGRRVYRRGAVVSRMERTRLLWPARVRLRSSGIRL